MSDVTPNSPNTIAVIIATTILAGISGYMLGVFSSLGFLPIPFLPNNGPNYRPSVSDSEEESEAEDIDEDILDHAPNWSNGLKQDEKDGLRMRAGKGEVKEGKEDVVKGVKGKENGKGGKKEETKNVMKGKPGEECKLVLVVRTDLGMTKGIFNHSSHLTYSHHSNKPSNHSLSQLTHHAGKIAAQASHATLACYKTSLSTSNPHLRPWEKAGQAKIAVQIKSSDELFTLHAKARSLGLVAEVIADAGRTQIEAGSYTVLGIGPAPKSVVDEITGGLKLL